MPARARLTGGTELRREGAGAAAEEGERRRRASSRSRARCDGGGGRVGRKIEWREGWHRVVEKKENNFDT